MISNLPPEDRIFIILGCEVPMVLRPLPSGAYVVIGTCFIHGIMDGEAILGPFKSPWRVHIRLERDGVARPSYFNSDSNTTVFEDPRLGDYALPPEWVPAPTWERCREDPVFCQKFKNQWSGQEINSDPRLLPVALTARGIKLEEIELV